jgi:hypothetical protein
MSSKYELKTVKLYDPQTGTYGASLDAMVSEISIVESIDFPGIRATISVTDSVSGYTKFVGNEYLQLQFILPDLEQSKSYLFKVYRVGPIIRLEKKAKYNIECISQEAYINESTNVFGSFKEKKISEIVSQVLTDDKFGMKVASEKYDAKFIEDTKDKFKCVVPNMRVFDAINWLAGKAVRKDKKANFYQSGFIFYENYDGFHFKSFDKIIEDAVNFKEYDCKKGGYKVVHPIYRYYPKKLTNDSVDVGVIESVTYPDVFNNTIAIRNGSYAGVFGTLALDVIPNSKVSTPSNRQLPYQYTDWNLSKVYDAQSHLGNINPFNNKDNIINQPRRLRMRGNMVHAWDKSGDEDIKLQTGEIQQRTEETAIYTFCRKLTFEAVKLQIRVAGNCALHVGNPLTVEIPKMIADDGKIEMDDVYTGVYIIAGVRHKIGGDVMHTELILVKDSLGSAKGK